MTKNVRFQPWTTTWISASQLSRDSEVNREIDETRSKQIADNFDPDNIGIITVSRRDDGSYVIIDGQHRVHAIQQIEGWENQKVPCKVYEGLTKVQEADLFLDLNDYRQVSIIDKFLVRITAREPIALSINIIVNQAGFVISRYAKDGAIVAVSAMERVYTGHRLKIRGHNPTALAWTLDAVANAWGRTKAAVIAPVILGIGSFFLRYGSKVDRPHLIERLSRIKGGADGLIRNGRAQVNIHGGSLAHGVADAVVNEYNRGIRKAGSRLESWRT